MENKLLNAESLFDEVINNYNSKVSQVYAFQFNANEKAMFLNMMNYFAGQNLKALGEEIKEKALLEFKGDEIIGIDCNSIKNIVDNHLQNLK